MFLIIINFQISSEANSGPYQLVSEISSSTMANGQSTAIFVDRNFNIYVPEPSFHRIDFFNKTGHNIQTLNFGRPELPVDVSVRKDGSVLFLTRFSDTVNVAQGSQSILTPPVLDRVCGLDTDNFNNNIVRDASKIVRIQPHVEPIEIITSIDAGTGGQLVSCPIEAVNQTIYYTIGTKLASTDINFRPELPPDYGIIGDIASDSQGNIFVTTVPWEVIKMDRKGNFVTQFDFEDEFSSNHTENFWLSKIDIDSNGTVYVLDPNSGKVRIFKQGGIGPAQMRSPEDIATDSSGNVYVADTQNRRIQKFTDTGDFVHRWDLRSTRPVLGPDPPFAVNVDFAGNVFVGVQMTAQNVQKFTNDGFFNKTWGSLGTGTGQFNKTSGIASDFLGNIYATEISNNRVQKFTNDGAFIKTWGSPCKLLSNNTPGCIDPDGMGPLTLGDGQFNSPIDVAVDSSGNVYVLDWGNRRIQKFTSDGIFIKKWGSFGFGNGKFFNPHGLAVGADDNVYVGDTSNIPIQKFTSGGLFLDKWGSFGTGDAQFNAINGIAADSLGNVYVLDRANHNIQKFTSDGIFIKKWGSEGIN